MITKKQLQERFQISDVTVTQTLRACGFDTKSTEYDDDEIEFIFAPARKLLEHSDPQVKKTYDQIKPWAEERRREWQVLKTGNDGDTSPLSDIINSVGDTLMEDLDGMLLDYVEANIDKLPQMFYRNLKRTMDEGHFETARYKFYQRFSTHLKSRVSNHSYTGLPGANDDTLESEAASILFDDEEEE